MLMVDMGLIICTKESVKLKNSLSWVKIKDCKVKIFGQIWMT